MKNPIEAFGELLARLLIGISAREIRYTFEDVRSEIRALRAEVRDELASLRREVEAVRADRKDGATSGAQPPAQA